jgi:hypothetical protein
VNAISDPADAVLPYSSRITGDSVCVAGRPRIRFAIRSFMFEFAWCSQ